MPMDRTLYPKNWNAIALQIKEDANWICQQCGRPCKRPTESWMEFCDRVRTGRMSECPVVAEVCDKPTRFILTVAHLNHQPSDCRTENLKALCSVCHLQMENKARATKQRLKRERLGQMSLW